MLINDNGVTREATPEEEEKYKKSFDNLTVNDTLKMLNDLGVDTND